MVLFAHCYLLFKPMSRHESVDLKECELLSVLSQQQRATALYQPLLCILKG